jgi:hypothetical protein
MFDPSNIERIKSEKQEKKRQSKAVKEMVLSLIPDEVKGTVNINVREIQCGDPNCSPIDTVITMVWESGGRGMFGLPMEISEVELDILKEFFPVFVFYLHL